MKAYAGYYKNEIREKSSSGGIFSALASYILEKNGVVYGVVMASDNYSAHFERATNEENLKKMLSSKYIQASVGDIFQSVKIDLDNRIHVLFSGTACQINGLKKYLQKDYENLFCVDVICHGVPSQKLWKQYLINREKLIGKCTEVNFRSKEQGWYESGIKENTLFTTQKQDDYMNLFLHDFCLRPSCYECVCKKDKQSDITLGDLWGVEQVAPELNDDMGLSTIITRTEKGKNLFLSIAERLEYKEISFQQAVLDNPAESHSSVRPRERDKFYIDLNKMGFEKMCSKYLETGFYWKFRGKVRRTLNKLMNI